LFAISPHLPLPPLQGLEVQDLQVPRAEEVEAVEVTRKRGLPLYFKR
jgi:hypothetical protein